MKPPPEKVSSTANKSSLNFSMTIVKKPGSILSIRVVKKGFF